MRSKDLIANAKKANAATLAAAFQTGDETKMTEALATFCGDIEESKATTICASWPCHCITTGKPIRSPAAMP